MAFLSQHRTDSYRQMLEEFIVMYRHEPCLWHIKNRDYYDRTKRNAALDRLLEKCREAEPAAVRDDVSKKINSLRTTYNKERQKVKDAEQAGGERVPKLWYYGLMSFLDDKESPALADGREEPETADTEELDLKEEYVSAVEEYEHLWSSNDSTANAKDIPQDDNEVAIENTRLSIEQSDSDDPILTVKTPRSKRSRVKFEYSNDTLQFEDSRSHIIDASASHSKRSWEGGTGDGDRHDFFGKYITCKLRDLPKQQGLLAEKLINEVLFEAECSNLTMKHKLTK